MDWCPNQADTAVAFGKSEQASGPVARNKRSWFRESLASDRRCRINEALSLI